MKFKIDYQIYGFDVGDFQPSSGDVIYERGLEVE